MYKVNGEKVCPKSVSKECVQKVGPQTTTPDNDPTNPRPKTSKSWKWTNVVKYILDNRKTYEGQGTKTVVIPSDPNALLEKFDLLMASKEAGNTGTRNELVSICDELLRQRVISKTNIKILC